MQSSLKNSELQTLIGISKTINSKALDLNGILECVMAAATETLSADASSLVLIDSKTGELIFYVAQGTTANAMKTIRMQPGEGIVGWVIANGETAVVNDVTSDERFHLGVDQDTGFNTRSILCVPLRTSKKLWGAIEIINKTGKNGFTENDIMLCEAIANQAAIAIENATLHQQLLKQERLAAIGETLAGLAHCIKNILCIIKNGSFIVEQNLKPEKLDTLIQGWEIVQRNNVFMEELVLDMLTFSKERQPSYRQLDINRLISNVTAMVIQRAQAKGVTLDLDLCPDNNTISADPTAVSRCLINLVGNAPENKRGRCG